MIAMCHVVTYADSVEKRKNVSCVRNRSFFLNQKELFLRLWNKIIYAQLPLNISGFSMNIFNFLFLNIVPKNCLINSEYWEPKTTIIRIIKQQ